MMKCGYVISVDADENRTGNNRKRYGNQGYNMKYTPEKANAIADMVREGNYNITAALCCGISETTFYRWMEDNEEFRESIKRARAESEREAVQNIKKAARDSWQAEAWFLERTDYRKWGKVDTHNVVNKELADFMDKLSEYREPHE